MITNRITEKPHDPPFERDLRVSISVTGAQDVSRIVQLLASGQIEHVMVAADMVRKLRALPGGVAALELLHEHGGPDYTTSYPGGHDPDEAGEQA
jgi:hypothetical protein